MPSRATSTDEHPDWPTWLLRDYARYWYVFGVLLLMVFGVGELARLGSPLGGAAKAALVVLIGLVVAVGGVGYILLWRRDSPAGVRLLRTLSAAGSWLRAKFRRTAPTADVPPPPRDEDGHRDDGDPQSDGRDSFG